MTHDDDEGNPCQPHCSSFNHAVNLTVLSTSWGRKCFASVKETSRNLCHKSWTVFLNLLGYYLISNLPYLNYEPFILVMVRMFSSFSLEHFSLNSASALVENERGRESERGQASFRF